MNFRWTVVTAAMVATAMIAPQAGAQSDLRCYQVKDPLSLTASVDIASELGLDPACKVSKSKTYCDKAVSDIVTAVDKKTGVPIPIIAMDPASVIDFDRICYKVSCPKPAVNIADQQVTDQFGTRTLSGFKTSMLCTAAVKGPRTPSTQVEYQLQVSGTGGGPALPTVVFTGGSGLNAIRAVGKHKGDYLPAHNRTAQIGISEAYFSGGTVSGSSDAWAAWYAEAIAMGAYCSTHTGDECEATWDASTLPRAATLTAVAQGGEVLATWQLSDAWPASLTVSEADGTGVSTGILQMTLSASVDQFAFADSDTVRALFDGVSPPAAVVPTPAATESDLDTFLTRHHDLDGMLLRLNALTLLASPSDPPSPPAARIPRYVSAAGDYALEIGGVVLLRFKEVTGLESEVEVIEFKDGDDSITHKRAGKAKYKNIVLKRGIVQDASLLEWYKKVLAGMTERKSGSIILQDREGNEIVRFSVTDGQAIRWKAPELNSNSDTHIVEEIEFVVERVERA